MNKDSGAGGGEVAAEQPASKQNPADHLKEYRWKPGQSGNPDGKPAGKSITAELRKLLDSGTTAIELAEVLLKLAKTPGTRGQVPAFKELLDRTEGKVPDTHKLETDVPVTIIFKPAGDRDV